jgi:hypothetical protein
MEDSGMRERKSGKTLWHTVFNPKIHIIMAKDAASLVVHLVGTMIVIGECARLALVAPAPIANVFNFGNFVGKVDGASGGRRVDSTMGRRYIDGGWCGRGFGDVIDDGNGESLN